MLENTESQEMYLTTIYALQKKNGMVRSVDVADERGYSKVSVHISPKNLAKRLRTKRKSVKRAKRRKKRFSLRKTARLRRNGAKKSIPYSATRSRFCRG